MEKNQYCTKEKADFIFNKIKKYYDNSAFKLVLEEINANEDIHSFLNVRNQLKLNKILSSSVMNLMLDAFEVDGNLQEFTYLFSTYRTTLERHTQKDTYALLQKYLIDREKNSNFKSRTNHSNVDIMKDTTEFIDDTFQISIRTNSSKTVAAKEIETDFLNSIEKPSFHISNFISDDEEAKHKVNTINTEQNRKAIHDDFFNSIKQPTVSKSKINESYEQLSFDSSISDIFTSQSVTNKTKPKKRKNDSLSSQTKIDFENIDILETDYKDKIDPISINNTILAKEDASTVASLRKKIQEIGLKTKIGDSSNEKIVAKREFIKDGQKGTQTIHKSGGKITEITIGTEDKKSSIKKTNIASNQKKQPPAKNKKSNKGATKPKHNKIVVDNKFLFIAILFIFVVASTIFIFKSFHNTSNKNQLEIQNESTNTVISTNTADTTNSETTSNQATNSSANDSNYILPSHTREVTQEDMAHLTKSELRLAINELFARHGWHFQQSGSIYEYFSKQSWYNPDLNMISSADAEKKFSAIERKNLSIIKQKFDSMP